MNKVLVDNAIMGPWIHVGTRMQLLSVARIGDELTARAKVIGNYDKKGHRFVELDALVVAHGRRRWRTAITLRSTSRGNRRRRRGARSSLLTHLSFPAKAGYPVRRGITVLSLTSLGFPVRPSSRSTTAVETG